MGRVFLFWVFCAIGIVINAIMGCGGDRIADSDMAIASGKIIDDFSRELKDELYKAIDDSGVVWAIRICAEKGPEISSRYSSIPGLTVRRVSTRYRNPGNIPDDFEREALEILESRPANAGDDYYRWIDVDGHKTFRFLKAIKIKATCLNCHGDKDKFSDELKIILGEKYPDDKAYGFTLDEYRGAFSVKIDWPEGRAAVDSILGAN